MNYVILFNQDLYVNDHYSIIESIEIWTFVNWYDR